MASEEGLEFRGGRLDDADFSGARLHGPNFEGTRITDGWLRNADISGFIEGLRVNGVEVAPLVGQSSTGASPNGSSCAPPNRPAWAARGR